MSSLESGKVEVTYNANGLGACRNGATWKLE